MTTPRSIFDHTPETLRAFCADHDMPGYAADQVLDWVYRKSVVDPERMTNLSKRHRAVLAEHMQFYSSDVLTHQQATDGTQKVLLGWHDDDAHNGNARDADTSALPVLGGTPARQTETVMIPTDRRRTACVSSQVGCPVGCAFCASGLGGLEGNLTRGQIVEQAHRLSALPDVPGTDHPDRPGVTNIVFMGMGEPLANFAAVTGAVRTLHASWGMGLSARRITISTVGLPQAIRKLVTFEIPVTLALSLHAPNDELRRQLIPWSSYTTIAELLDACDEYFRKTGREITLEYILLGGVNDQEVHARELARVARRLRANINLIRYNEVRGLPFNRPRSDDVRRFQQLLQQHHINTHIRASRGRDIAAACGQLRHERKQAGATGTAPQRQR